MEVERRNDLSEARIPHLVLALVLSHTRHAAQRFRDSKAEARAAFVGAEVVQYTVVVRAFQNVDELGRFIKHARVG